MTGGLPLRGIPDVDPAVCLIALALFTKACKQHRSVQQLARAALGLDALAITRCLFETTLAFAFVLKPRVTLRAQGRRLPPVGGWPLGCRLRARLYVANIAFENERTLREFGRTRTLRRFRRSQAAAREVERQVLDAEKMIGPEWSRRLRGSRSYSGLSAKDLALSLGLAPAYATLYRYASWTVHAVDLLHYATVVDDVPQLAIAPSPAEVQSAVACANSLLLACVRTLNSRFRLGHEGEIADFSRILDVERNIEGG